MYVHNYTEKVYKSLSIIYLSFMNGEWHLINQDACWAIKQARAYMYMYQTIQVTYKVSHGTRNKLWYSYGQLTQLL